MKGTRAAFSTTSISLLLALGGLSCGRSVAPNTGSTVEVGLAQAAKRVDAVWAAPSDRAARMVDAAATLAVSPDELSTPLQALTRELERITASATTPAQREYVAHLARARDLYRELIGLQEAIRNAEQRDTGSHPIRIATAGERTVDVQAVAARSQVALEEVSGPDGKIHPRDAIQRLKKLAYDEICAAHDLAY